MNLSSAEHVAPGDIITYRTNPAPHLPDHVTIYILATSARDGLVELRGAAFVVSSWPHLYCDRLLPGHQVRITRVQWATLTGQLMSHVIDPDTDGATTLCEAEGARELDAADMPRLPVCRSCG